MAEEGYIVAGSKPWSRRIFDERIAPLHGSWTFVASPDELTEELVDRVAPRFIFFMHWSWRVGPELTDHHECVNFHMTEVPFGRGGSPLQNLVVRGHQHTKLTALRMTSELDAGPVYGREDLCLRGTAEEVYVRATELAAEMIAKIVRDRPEPLPQEGEPVFFARRTPAESEVPTTGSLEELHDFIRMLDADAYPHAFLRHGSFRLELRRSALYDGAIIADVHITREDEER